MKNYLKLIFHILILQLSSIENNLNGKLLFPIQRENTAFKIKMNKD